MDNIEEIKGSGGAGQAGSADKIRKFQDLQKFYEQMKANSVVGTPKPAGEENREEIGDDRETIAERGKGSTKDTIGLSTEAQKLLRENLEKGQGIV